MSHVSTQNDLSKPQIVIAGASGYVGRALIPKLLERFPDANITALSRGTQTAHDPRVQWKTCDLFSIDSIVNVLPKKIDLAFYLVHSMGPTAHLDQGNFADYDLILADNFARAVKPLNLKQLVYLGGLIPNTRQLSRHLKSRLEVEETFSFFRLPTTFLRAGLILGAGGSSFQILTKLVTRLPIMICPRWTQNKTTPVDLATVLRNMIEVALNERYYHKTFDLAGCKPLTYIQMMRLTANKMGKKKIFIPIPFFSPLLSRLWVSLVTNTPKSLVYPLIESLAHEMVARPEHTLANNASTKSYYDLLEDSFFQKIQVQKRSEFRIKKKCVRSVQRLCLPGSKSAHWARRHYIRWLPRFLTPFIRVWQLENRIFMCFIFRKFVLLELELPATGFEVDRQEMKIRSGLLVGKLNEGRLEFRTVLGGQFLMTAIHDYKPSLPWPIYVLTQAQLHLWVMRSFRRLLNRINTKFISRSQY